MDKIDHYKLLADLTARLDMETLQVRKLGTDIQWRLDHLIKPENPNKFEMGSLEVVAEELKPHLEEIKEKVDGLLAGIAYFKNK